MTAKDRIDYLRAELHRHNYNYYVLNAPVITDKTFDEMMRELQDLERAHPEYSDDSSPTMRVGSDLNKEFAKVTHRYPMLSLGNTYSVGEVSEWYERTRQWLNEPFEVCAELKYDGTSISIIYDNGRLVRAVTRGDGVQGDDVTDNVKTIQSIPLVLHGSNYPTLFEGNDYPALFEGNDYPALFEMRGEILMSWEVFDRLNQERRAQEETLFANPRNAASGSLKLQNSSMVAARKLQACFYYMLGEELPSDDHYANIQKAKAWGIPISPFVLADKAHETSRKCGSVEQIFDFIQYWDKERITLPVPIDGIVLKVNSLRQQRNLGSTAKSPQIGRAHV
jgi:DNA ligase (NAD+)